jgi:hypothetical protein
MRPTSQQCPLTSIKSSAVGGMTSSTSLLLAAVLLGASAALAHGWTVPAWCPTSDPSTMHSCVCVDIEVLQAQLDEAYDLLAVAARRNAQLQENLLVAQHYGPAWPVKPLDISATAWQAGSTLMVLLLASSLCWSEYRRRAAIAKLGQEQGQMAIKEAHWKRAVKDLLMVKGSLRNGLQGLKVSSCSF